MIPSAPFGRTGHQSTRVIFGAAALGGMSQARADATLAAVHGWGINHIDTAASYGASEDRLKPWLADPPRRRLPGHQDRRARRALRPAPSSSARSSGWHVDHVDLIQLHNLVEPDEWDVAHGPGGAVEALVRARDEGLVRAHRRHRPRPAHRPRMHLRSLERFPFDSVLFPYNHSLLARPRRTAPTSTRCSSSAPTTGRRCRRSRRSPGAAGRPTPPARGSAGTSRSRIPTPSPGPCATCSPTSACSSTRPATPGSCR